MKIIPVTLLICIFKEPSSLIKQSINSFLNDDLYPKKIILINDNPALKRDVLINYLQRKLFILGIKLSYIKNSTNIGLTASLNKGIKNVDTKYIARLDPDDKSINKRLSRQYTFMEKNKDLIILGGIGVRKSNKKIIPFFSGYKTIKKISYFMNPLIHSSFFIRSEYIKNYNYPNVKTSQDFALITAYLNKGYKIDILKGDPIVIVDDSKTKTRISNERLVSQYSIFFVLIIHRIFKINLYKKNLLLNNDKLNLIFFIPAFFIRFIGYLLKKSYWKILY